MNLRSAALCAWLFSCAGGEHHAAPTQVGSLDMMLALPNGATISEAEYTITQPGSSFRELGTVPVGGQSTLSFMVRVPAGLGYSLELSAPGCDAQRVPFDVLAGQTTSVLLTLRCGQDMVAGPDGGNLQVSVDVAASAPASCPEVDGVTALPLELRVGTAAALRAFATAPASFDWSVTPASAGSFSAQTAATAFTCSAPGTHSIGVTVRGDAPCPPSVALPVAIACSL